MFGAGGVLLELIGDVAFGPPGLDANRARDMIASTRVARLLDGFRGAPKCDIESLVSAIVAMGRLASELGDMVESVEINPLLVRPDGAFALDAKLDEAKDPGNFEPFLPSASSASAWSPFLFEVTTRKAAFAKVQCQVPPRYFTDYLVLARLKVAERDDQRDCPAIST